MCFSMVPEDNLETCKLSRSFKLPVGVSTLRSSRSSTQLTYQASLRPSSKMHMKH